MVSYLERQAGKHVEKALTPDLPPETPEELAARQARNLKEWKMARENPIHDAEILDEELARGRGTDFPDDGGFRPLVDDGGFVPIPRSQPSRPAAPAQAPSTSMTEARDAADQRFAAAYAQTATPEGIAAHPLTRTALGAAKPFLAGSQLIGKAMDKIAQATGIPYRPGEALDEYIRRTDELVKQGRAQAGSEGIDWAEMLGNVLSPALLKLLKLPLPKSVAGKVAQGTAIGGTAGLLTPVVKKEGESAETFEQDFARRKGEQIGTGAAFGAAIPSVLIPASKLAGMINRGLIEPWAAPAAVKGRAFLEAAGDKADEIIRLLRRPQEIVPGSRPTAGQAATEAGSAEFSALQESARRAKPSDYDAVDLAQRKARLDAVRSVGKDKDALKAAEDARAETTGELYREAYDTMVKRDPLLRQLWKNPYFRKAIPDAWDLARAEGISIRKDLTHFLHFVKVGLDKQLAAGPATGGQALAGMERRAVQDVKKSLVAWIENKNPKYGEARTTFADMSEPVNQMKVGQVLEDKLAPALSDEAKQTANVFANATRDASKVIHRATGGPRFQELKDVLTTEQLRAVESVQDDLARNMRYEELARKGAGTGPNAMDIATTNLKREGGPIPAMLNRGVMVANAIIARVQGKIDKKLAIEMAVEMLNPQKVGDSLAKAKAQAAFNAQMVQDLHKAMRVPAIVGANKEAKKK
jgi:hypothetical protein